MFFNRTFFNSSQGNLLACVIFDIIVIGLRRFLAGAISLRSGACKLSLSNKLGFTIVINIAVNNLNRRRQTAGVFVTHWSNDNTNIGGG